LQWKIDYRYLEKPTTIGPFERKQLCHQIFVPWKSLDKRPKHPEILKQTTNLVVLERASQTNMSVSIKQVNPL